MKGLLRILAAAPSVLHRFARPVFEGRVRRLRERASTVTEARLVARRLINLRRFEDADAVLGIGLSAFPGHPDLLMQHAFSAHNRGLYAEAATRWHRVRDARPESPMAWCGIAANTRELLDLDAATATIEEALRRFPDDPQVIGEAARIADRRVDYDCALALWRRMLDFRHVDPECRQGYSYNLIMLGRLEEAEVELARARRAHPDHRGLHATWAMLALAREDWSGAIAILNDYRARFPDDASGRNLLGHALMSKDMASADAARGVPAALAPVEIVRVEDDAVRALLLRFESIGTDCEFGLVQRRYGAEPLGLLRWNTISAQGLLRGLADRFEGLGEPMNTQLSCLPESGEYYVSDSRLGLHMHTFILKGQSDADTLHPKMCRRLDYLKNKFVDDLEAAEKICVYKSEESGLELIRAVYRGLRAYGPVRLLCIKEASADPARVPFRGQAGTVRRLEDGLFVGFLDHLGDRDGVWDIAYDDWVAICGAVEEASALVVGPSDPEQMNRVYSQ